MREWGLLMRWGNIGLVKGKETGNGGMTLQAFGEREFHAGPQEATTPLTPLARPQG